MERVFLTYCKELGRHLTKDGAASELLEHDKRGEGNHRSTADVQTCLSVDGAAGGGVAGDGGSVVLLGLSAGDSDPGGNDRQESGLGPRRGSEAARKWYILMSIPSLSAGSMILVHCTVAEH